jgi:cytochrome c553
MRRLVKTIGLLTGLVKGAPRGIAQGLRDPVEPAVEGGTENPIVAVGRLGLLSWLIVVGFLGAVAAVGGFLLAASGVIPIKASSGHWPITAWILEFSMHRSIATHAMRIQAPALEDRSMILKGAGHYDIGCRPCHGSPELQRPRIAARMTPPPPYLPPVLHEWTPEQLFYLVKHGVKFTGMPAWPSQQRDDEVWAMVAFLVKFRHVSAEDYRRLSHGDVEATRESAPEEDMEGPKHPPQGIAENCGRCHGLDGGGRGGAFPKLAGQKPEYFTASLRAYARGDRHSGIMQPIAAGLSETVLQEVSRYYTSLPPVAGSRGRDGDAARRGESIALNGVEEARIAACAECHGPSATPRNPHYPVLSGQPAEYLALQLRLFKDGIRGGSSYAHVMHPIASRLTKAQMRDVAAYYAGRSEP